MRLKKGISRDLIPEMILAVVVGVIILVGTQGGLNYFGEKSKKDQCSSSLLAMQSTVIQPGGVELASSTWHPKCQKENVVIKITDSQYKENSIKRQIAETVRNCVEKCGNCNLDPFAVKPFDAKPYCIICYQVSFGKDVKNDDQFNFITGILDYLKTTRPTNSALTYWGNFMNTRYCSDQGDTAMFKEEDFEKIDTSKIYNLVFIFDEHAVTGGSTYQLIRLIPQEEISSLKAGGDKCAELYQ